MVDHTSTLTPPLQAHLAAEDEPYFAALGRFITAYAMAEQQVHLFARHLTRLNDAKARIVFSGMRLGDLAERIRGLLRVNNTAAKRYNEADQCLRQFDYIATQRNNLVHRFVRYGEKKILVTNVVIAKSVDASEHHAFTIADLENMDSDCTAITLRLRLLCGGKESSPSVRKWARQPWRYTRPQPAQTTKQRPSTPQSQKRQLPASRE